MTFTDAVRTCLREYITFSGRASRSEYWWFSLFCLIVGFAASNLEDFINFLSNDPEGPHILSLAVTLATFLPSLAVTWRRLHDIGRSGLWYPGLVFMLPFGGFLVLFFANKVLDSSQASLPIVHGLLALMLTGLIWLIYWFTRPSQAGPNRFGPNPLEVTP